MDAEEDGKDGKDVLNRSRRDRLTKAAKQGYGPWAEASQRGRATEGGAATRARQQLAAVSEHAPRAPLLRQQRAATLRRSTEDEPDLSSFLASKPPGSAQKKAQGVSVSILAPSGGKQVPAVPQASSKLELRLSSQASERAMAASAGARPKAAARSAAAAAAASDESPERPAAAARLSEGVKGSVRASSRPPASASSSEGGEESGGEQPRAPRPPRAASPLSRGSSSERAQGSRGQSREERRQRRREERRKREEWRKQWKEEKKRRGREERQRSRSRQGKEGSDSDSSGSSKPRDKADPQQNRAMTWSALNSFGVTTARDAQKKYVGQVSDADLDRRLREQAAEDARGGKLMSEAEVLAKMQKSRGKRR